MPVAKEPAFAIEVVRIDGRTQVCGTSRCGETEFIEHGVVTERELAVAVVVTESVDRAAERAVPFGFHEQPRVGGDDGAEHRLPGGRAIPAKAPDNRGLVSRILEPVDRDSGALTSRADPELDVVERIDWTRG